MCYVRQLAEADEIDEWVQYDDHFYVDLEEDDDGSLTEMDADALTHCTVCCDEQETRLSREEESMTRNGPLIGLELFSGRMVLLLCSGPWFLFNCRCWRPGHRNGHVRLCRDEICSGIFSVRCCYLQVCTIHAAEAISFFHFLGQITPKQRCIVKIQAYCFDMQPNLQLANGLDLSYQMTVKLIVHLCRRKAKLILSMAVREFESLCSQAMTPPARSPMPVFQSRKP